MKAHSETSTFLVTLLSHPEGGRKNTDVSHCMFGERSYSQAGSAFTPEVPIAGTWSRQGRISEKREDFFYAACGGGHCCPTSSWPSSWPAKFASSGLITMSCTVITI